ncbi:Plant UBX domain-containing protein 10 [Capsicum baccatum]|uniref:Plant UBX domain-containing protein 10 n=1 Tax=Capsicum baccatum TaxID=33114 RepID=A0A2G2VFH4_CAPBA|nr:Plant UBX domain-containing protein 10 [Capsicum baccatum]
MSNDMIKACLKTVAKWTTRVELLTPCVNPWLGLGKIKTTTLTSCPRIFSKLMPYNSGKVIARIAFIEFREIEFSTSAIEGLITVSKGMLGTSAARERQRIEEQEHLKREAAEAERKRKEEEAARERAAHEAAEREAALVKMRQEKLLSLGPEPEKGPDVTQLSNFKDCIERLRTLKSSCLNHGESCGADSGRLVQDLQLRWMKGISVAEDRIKELQDKVCLGFYERDYRFLHLELEALLQIVQGVKLGARDDMSLLNRVISVDVKETTSTTLPNVERPLPALGLELDRKSVEKNGPDGVDQMECYYEALVQELEENQKQMLAGLQSLRNEHSNCLYTILNSKTEMELMRQDIIDKLQKDLELLSSQVVPMFETNENLIKQAIPEPSQSQFLGYVDVVQNLGEYDNKEQLRFQDQHVIAKKLTLGGDVLNDDLKRSLCLQEELYRKVEKELGDMYSVNLHFRCILQGFTWICWHLMRRIIRLLVCCIKF